MKNNMDAKLFSIISIVFAERAVRFFKCRQVCLCFYNDNSYTSK